MLCVPVKVLSLNGQGGVQPARRERPCLRGQGAAQLGFILDTLILSLWRTSNAGTDTRRQTASRPSSPYTLQRPPHSRLAEIEHARQDCHSLAPRVALREFQRPNARARNSSYGRGERGSATRSYLPQHFLNLLPEPQGQGSFRPRFLVLLVAPCASFRRLQ